MTDLAEDLSKKGWEVTALSSDSAYVAGPPLERREELGAIRIERVRTYRFSRGGLLRRAISYLSFYPTAFFRLMRIPRQDVILVLTTPPLIGLVAYGVCFFRGSRWVYLVQDLYPDIAVRLGVLKEKNLLTKTLESISRFLLKRSHAVIALGECMKKRLLEKGVPGSKIHVIRNWADEEKIRPIPRLENKRRSEHGLTDKFVVQYSGNMGRAHDFDALLQAMKMLSAESGIKFVFIGSGPKEKELLDFLEAHPEVNAITLPYVPREELSVSLGMADVSLLLVADGLEGLVVPSKLYGIMASGRPALYGGPEESDAAVTILREKCGLVVPNHSPEAIVAAILSLKHEPAMARHMGAAGRESFEREYSRKHAQETYHHLLLNVAQSR